MSMISHSTTRSQGEGSGGVADMVRGESIGGSMEFYPSQWGSAEQSVGRNEKEAVASQTGLNEHGSNQTQGNSQSTSTFDDAPTVTVTAAPSDDGESGTEDGSCSQWTTQEMQFRGLGPIHPDYWYHGDQAGGFLLDFGEFKGRPVREVRWDWLQWALRQLNKQPRHEALLIAIARFKAGHSEDLRDNWRDYRVSFGVSHYNKPLGSCATWWVRERLESANDDPIWASNNALFIVAAKAALGLPADPDDPEPKPVDLSDPLFAPRKVTGPQKNTIDKYLVENGGNDRRPSQSQSTGRAIVPKDFSKSQLPSSSAPLNRSQSPSGSDWSFESSPAPSTTKSTAKGKGKKREATVKSAASQPLAPGTQADPIVLSDSEDSNVPDAFPPTAVDPEGPSGSTRKRTVSERSRSEGEGPDNGPSKRLRHS